MPNAAAVTDKDLGAPRVLLIGGPGSGKTTLLRTLPGKTFVYAFDPNCVRSLRGAENIEYEAFLPGLLNLGVKTLSSSSRDDKGQHASVDAYLAWEKDFETKINKGYFDSFDNICLDSCTSLADIIMDRVQFLNGRLGKHPEQADWTAQMATFVNVFRTLTSMNKVLVATAHSELRQEDDTGLMRYQPLFTGRLRIRVPLLFSDVLGTESDVDRGKKSYSILTVGDRRHQYIRCSIPGIDPVLDTTIEDWTHQACQSQGLGKLLSSSLT